MKKKKWILFLLLLVIGTTLYSSVDVAYGNPNEETEQQLNQNITDILESLDTSAMDQLLSGLTAEERAIFSSSSVTEKIRAIVSGDVGLDYNSFFSYFFQILGISVKKLLPFILTLLGICVAASIMNVIKGKFASKSVESIINFAFSALIIILVMAQVMVLITNVSKAVLSIQKQINIFFPIILTLMTAVGSVSSVSVYQPAIAILSSGIAEVLVAFVLPMCILSIVFCIIGSISGGIKLNKLSDFFSGTIKWLMSSCFFIFLAFLSVQGITASIYDSVSIRATKFAISNYVPIIGGYLSEGMNLIMAGSVLIKNAVGMCAILILIITIAPVILQVIVFRLSLSFVAAVIEPIGNENISKMITQISKCLKTLIAIVFGIFFLYFIFLILVVCTGNLML